MGASNASLPMLSVYDGRQCVGFVLARGRAGYEAFNTNERSLGMFKTRDAVIHELTGSERADT